jgi:hypothetical protein
LRPSKVLLHIPEHPLQRQYSEERERKYNKFYYMALFFLAVIYIIQSMLILIVRKSFGFPSGFIAMRGSFSGMLVFLILIGKYLEHRIYLNRVLLGVVLIYGALLLAIQSQYTSVKSIWFHRITLLELVVVLLVGVNSRKFKFSQTLFLYGIYSVIWVIFYIVNPNMDYEYIFYYFIFAFYIIINYYLTEFNDIRRFNIGLKQNQKNYLQDNLISQLLPTHVLFNFLS